VEPLLFLEAVMRGEVECRPIQLQAAIAAARYRHGPGGGGKKAAAERAAEEVAEQYETRSPPELRRVA
jgi:hypothetical protein